jgi:hypothetical protein
MELSKAIEVSSTREEYTVADRGASWYHEPISVDPEEVFCLVQRWFFLHTGRNCSAGTIHGFKEVRNCSAGTIHGFKGVRNCSAGTIHGFKEVRNCSAGTIHGFKEVRYAERWQPRLTCSLYLYKWS